MQNHHETCKDALQQHGGQTPEITDRSQVARERGPILEGENGGRMPAGSRDKNEIAEEGGRCEGGIRNEFGAGRTRGPRSSGGLEFEPVEPWPERVDGRALLDDLERVMTRFVVLPKHAAEALALWTLHTYAFHLRDVSTYLGIESPEKRCGKTTLLSVLSELAHRPVAAANISSSAVFRVIEETQPTLLIDEADTLLQGNDELRGILNSGYTRKTAYVVRVAANKSHVRGSRSQARKVGEEQSQVSSLNPQARGVETGLSHVSGPRPQSDGSGLASYSCWCPKVMAAIGRLPETLADRCIVIRMQRKTASEECERLRNLETMELKRRCLRFVQDNAAAIASARPEIPLSLNDRAGDIWEPLLALADLAGGSWPEKARVAAAGLAANAQESSPIGSLLLDILVCFVKTNVDRLHSRELIEWLLQCENRPWVEMRNGKAINDLWLAQQLRPYGIRPKSVWIEGVSAKGYVQADFAEVFRRYIPRSEVEALLGHGAI